MGTILAMENYKNSKNIKEKPTFETIYQQFYGKILGYVCTKITDRSDAEDLTCDCFLYCYHHYAEYDPEKSAVSTWLYLVVNSRIKNYYRDHKGFADLSALENVLEDRHADVEQGIYLEQLRSSLARAIKTLPQRQQQIVVMRYFQDKSSGEIAEALGMTPGNVRVQLSRALDRLQEHCREFLL